MCIRDRFLLGPRGYYIDQRTAGGFEAIVTVRMGLGQAILSKGATPTKPHHVVLKYLPRTCGSCQFLVRLDPVFGHAIVVHQADQGIVKGHVLGAGRRLQIKIAKHHQTEVVLILMTHLGIGRSNRLKMIASISVQSLHLFMWKMLS